MTDPRPAAVLRGKVAVALMKKGWRPPPLQDHQALALVQDMIATHPKQTNRLTMIESDTLTYLAHGLTVGEVAQRMCVGVETIKARQKIIRAKLGAKNTCHAVALAMHQGIITLEDA